MTRRALALAALWLLACSPVEPGGAEASPAPVQIDSARKAGAAAASKARAKAAKAAPSSRSATPSGAYQYVDESGRVQFAARLEDVPVRQRSTAVQISASPAAPRRAPAPQLEESDLRTNAPVVVYTTRSCGYCRAAMAYMDKIGQDYENRDVQVDEDARAEYLELTGGEPGVPVIVVGQAWMQGWNQKRFDKLLAASR